MIARIWHGIVPVSKTDEYLTHLKKTSIPDYKKISGNSEVFVLKRTEGKKSHIYVLSFWDSKESIAEFAGDDYEVAQYYPDDIKFLFEFEPFAKHYDVIFHQQKKSEIIYRVNLLQGMIKEY